MVSLPLIKIYEFFLLHYSLGSKKNNKKKSLAEVVTGAAPIGKGLT